MAQDFTVDIKNFQNICRACLHLGDLKPLINSKMTAILKNITDIEIEDDGELPRNLCQFCIKQLEDIALFVETFKNNDAFLRQILEVEHERSIGYVDTKFQGCEDEIDTTELYSEPLPDDNKNLIEFTEENSDEASLIKNHRRKRRISNYYEKDNKELDRKKRIEECACHICGKKFTRRGGLKRHFKIHLGIKPFECETCGKTFVEKATLNRHYLIHTGEKPFECNLCGKSTTRKDQILEHITKHHPNAVNCDFIITENRRGDTEINEANNPNNGAKQEVLSRDLKDEDASFEVNKDTNTEHKQKTKKRIEISLCNLCGKVFRRRGYLKNHMAIHAKIKPFVCVICGKGFTQRHALSRHNLVHTKERPFQCNLCGKTFTRKEILMEHLKNHEEGMKPYLCYHCGKCFSNKDYLSKHLKYYMPGKGKKKEADKKCVCPHCGKQLHSISYLKTHLLTHTGEKPFECKICGNKFTVQRSLNHHLNIHKGIKPYQCTQCEKAFRTSSSLRKHGLLHTGERPFKCTSCEKGFIRRSHLKRHLRTH